MTWKKYTDPVFGSELYIPNVRHLYYTGTTLVLPRDDLNDEFHLKRFFWFLIQKCLQPQRVQNE